MQTLRILASWLVYLTKRMQVKSSLSKKEKKTVATSCYNKQPSSNYLFSLLFWGLKSKNSIEEIEFLKNEKRKRKEKYRNTKIIKGF